MDVPAVGAPRKAGDWEYFTLRRRGELVGSIYRRKASAAPSVVSPDGEYEKVVDALALQGLALLGLGVLALPFLECGRCAGEDRHVALEF
jgi:hypothetical protein